MAPAISATAASGPPVPNFNMLATKQEREEAILQSIRTMKERKAQRLAEGTASTESTESTASKKRKADEDAPTENPAAKKPAKAKASKNPIDIVKARIAKSLVRAIKKTPHSSMTKKPYSEVQEGLTVEEATELLGGNLAKQTLTEEEDIKAWLNMDDLVIHPVNCKGMKTICSASTRSPKIYLWAGIIQLDIRYVKTTKLLVVKARTEVVGSGRPQ